MLAEHRTLRRAALVVLLVAAAAGCKKKTAPAPVETDQYAFATYVHEIGSVCDVKPAGAEPVRYRTPAYAKSDDPKAPSKVAVFRRYADVEGSHYARITPSRLAPIAAADTISDLQLVACVDQKRVEPGPEPVVCSYSGNATVKTYDTTYTVRIVEPRTAKVLATDTFTLDRRTEGCAATEEFTSDAKQVWQGPDVAAKLLADLLPFEPAGIAYATSTRDELDAVCSGGVAPLAPAYDPSKTAHSAHVVYFAEENQSMRSTYVPDGLERAGSREGAAKRDLVACVTGKPAKKKKTCEFTGDKTLELDDGTFEVSLREARTGKVVDTKTFKSAAPYGYACPFNHNFWSTTDRAMVQIDPSFQKWLRAVEGAPAPAVVAKR